MRNRILSGLRLASVNVALIGCGAGTTTDVGEDEVVHLEEPEIVTVEQDLVASCASAQADVVWPDFTTGQDYASPTIYSNPRCSKSWVYETFDRFPDVEGLRAWIGVDWTDRWPRNQVQCENGKLSVKFMSRPDTSSSYVVHMTTIAPLFWNATTSFCEYPSLVVWVSNDEWTGQWWYFAADGELEERPNFGLPSFHGRQVKIAVSATTPKGTTQSVSASVAALP